MLKNLRNSRRYKDDKEAEKRVKAMKDELLLPPKLTPMRDPAAEAIAKEAAKNFNADGMKMPEATEIIDQPEV